MEIRLYNVKEEPKPTPVSKPAHYTEPYTPPLQEPDPKDALNNQKLTQERNNAEPVSGNQLEAQRTPKPLEKPKAHIRTKDTTTPLIRKKHSVSTKSKSENDQKKIDPTVHKVKQFAKPSKPKMTKLPKLAKDSILLRKGCIKCGAEAHAASQDKER